MIRAAALLALLGLGGCAITPTASSEIAWQALNVVDTGQTVTIARNPDKWREADPVTGTLIGSHPSERSVMYTMAGYALVHIAITAWLDHEAQRHPGTLWGPSLAAWQSGTILDKGYDVASNARFGIKPWGSKDELKQSN